MINIEKINTTGIFIYILIIVCLIILNRLAKYIMIEGDKRKSRKAMIYIVIFLLLTAMLVYKIFHLK